MSIEILSKQQTLFVIVQKWEINQINASVYCTIICLIRCLCLNFLDDFPDRCDPNMVHDADAVPDDTVHNVHHW